jgi:alcohol dehydrogenase class IV
VQDKPTAEELLEALAQFLDAEVIPAFDGRRRFHAIVAANVARIVAREIRLGPEQAKQEYAALCDLLGKEQTEQAPTQATLAQLNAELCKRIDEGLADNGVSRKKVLDFLRSVAAAKLAIDNPKMLPR